MRPDAFADAAILVRVAAAYTGVAATQTDNVTYDAYLAGPQSQRSFDTT
jgi:hypothetical protein